MKAGGRLDTLEFGQPITIAIEYDEANIGPLDENSLVLRYWDRDQNRWQDAACGDLEHHPDENRLAVPICHLTEFGLFGEPGGQKIYLPLIEKDQ
ncbi:hypothetical protein ACFLXQ_07305 [Chloroflexota bacterium]